MISSLRNTSAVSMELFNCNLWLNIKIRFYYIEGPLHQKKYCGFIGVISLTCLIKLVSFSVFNICCFYTTSDFSCIDVSIVFLVHYIYFRFSKRHFSQYLSKIQNSTLSTSTSKIWWRSDELLRIFDFQYSGRPPSCILKFSHFYQKLKLSPISTSI